MRNELRYLATELGMGAAVLKIMDSSAVRGASAEVARELTAFASLRKRLLEQKAAGKDVASEVRKSDKKNPPKK